MKQATTYNLPGNLPRTAEDVMGIELLPDGRTLIKHHYRRRDGKATTLKKTIDSQDKRKISLALMDLISSVEGSLTLTDYTALSKNYRQARGEKGMKWHFDRMESELGNIKPNKKFAFHFDQAIAKFHSLGYSQNTIANLASIAQRVLTLAWEQHIISEMPIRDFNIRREYRDRIRTVSEKQAFENAMILHKSPLYWSVRFLQERPVRGRSDLWNMTTENLVLIGPGAPYIKYKPLKTASRKQEYTFLPLADISPDILQYLKHGRPADCPYLFPRVFQNKKWEPMGYPINHWRTLCEKAEISDFHIHDLKHEAITHMIRDQKYSIEMLKELGIQYSDQSIAVYWNKSAVSILENLPTCQDHIIHCQEKKAANV